MNSKFIWLLFILFLVLPISLHAQVLLHEDFESTALNTARWETNVDSSRRGGFETRPEYVHSGKQSFRLTAPENGGQAGDANLRHFFLPGVEKAYFRWYARFAEDFNQGPHMHWCVVSCSRTDNKWSAFGKAGIRPKGDDFAVTNLEPDVHQGKYPPPGVIGTYTYWPEMTISGDSVHYWGNRFEPETPFVIERGKWYCFEIMLKLNTPGKPDGEQAFWVDGKELYRQGGFRWRDSDILRINSLTLDVYIHQARQDNTCWFDDVVISTEYIGPLERKQP